MLRLRRTPHGGVLTFKGPREIEDGLKSREERETSVDDPDEVRAILRKLGYRPLFRYQKYRETWTHRGQEIEVDETPIGAFLEIEGDAEGIHAVAGDLGFSPSDFVTESYVGLFFAAAARGTWSSRHDEGHGPRRGAGPADAPAHPPPGQAGAARAEPAASALDAGAARPRRRQRRRREPAPPAGDGHGRAGAGRAFGLRIRYSREPALLGTGEGRGRCGTSSATSRPSS